MANSDTISYNTEGMRQWSNDINKAADEYLENFQNLYREVENFVTSTEFKGKLSDEFFQGFESKKEFFENKKDIIEECSKYVSSRAETIDNTETQLINEIRRHNYFE